MAYSGYLLKFGSTILPYKFIRAQMYQITPNQRLDLDSYRDANGELHRDVLSHTATKIEWETPYLTNTDLQSLKAVLNSGITDATQRKATVEYYDTETDTYKTGIFYMPDVVHKIYTTRSNGILYFPTRYALIEY